MEVQWLSLMDLRKTYVFFPHSPPINLRLQSAPLAGFGKRILWLCIHIRLNELNISSSSAIIQDVAGLREAGLALMAYFYFDFKDLDKQHRRNLLPSLLIQLSFSLVLVATSSPSYILHTAVVHESPAMAQ